MPDISMCKNNECPLKQKCYRYRAVPNHLQTYASFKPNDKGICEYFWKIEKGMHVRKTAL